MGDHCQVSTSTSEGMARFDCATHRERGSPRPSRKKLKTPRLGLNMRAQIRAIATGVATIGSKMTVRANPLPGKSRLKSTAMPMPTSSCSGTATKVK